MTGYLSLNPSILSTWKSTLAVAFQGFRKPKFATEDTFEFIDFDPQVNFNGMTVTNPVIMSRYLKLKNLLFFSIEIYATLAAPFAAVITITIPGTLATSSSSLPITRAQSGGCLTQNGLPLESGIWYGNANSNQINLVRTAGAYGAGTGRVNANGFVEIK